MQESQRLFGLKRASLLAIGVVRSPSRECRPRFQILPTLVSSQEFEHFPLASLRVFVAVVCLVGRDAASRPRPAAYRGPHRFRREEQAVSRKMKFLEMA